MSAPWKMKATTGGKQFEIPEAGSHPAVLVGLIDLGTHTKTYKNKDGTESDADYRQVYLLWELTGMPISGTKDRNHWIARSYTLAFSQKAALRGMVESWAGKKFQDDQEFDISLLLGKKFLLTIVHGTSNAGNTYAKLDGVGPLPKGMPVPEPRTKPFAWTIGDGPLPHESWLPFIFGERVADVIAASQEMQAGDANESGAVVGASVSASADDEAPF